ncbi:ABC1 kinase family protein [Pseudoxanthomonas wuyuanensis]|uniref:ABC1 kinase family protein n=1 Tax=Pseudoxanthomonas wuyuanensis TaxID=1073196 RepID=UPI000BE32FB7|nr:AarF/UbiB family protein [Pseudoxanthomonas wuyuanensis]KAF1722158.1 ubiquinone biosynthesis protein UbiB [Pseudoxanthomonas wuyuanensis]
MWETLGAIRDLGRVHQIASILIRYGFGDLVHRVGMSGALEKAGQVLHWQTIEELSTLDAPTRVRRAMEDLGPTFVKLGQVLATRVDLFPPEWILEFGKLQNAAPALDYAQIHPQLCEDLGEEPENVFARIDQVPLAAASLAQAHRAWLADGTAVILKVRRPGIRKIIEADLRLLSRMAEIVEAQAPDLQRYRPREVVHQFTLSLRRELDFAAECRNAERIAQNFVDRPEIVIPGVYWQWTGERLNVQAFVDGISACDLDVADAAGLDRKLLARRGAETILKMVLEDGFFHADPHPGNIFFLPGNRIGLIDFGMIGRLSEQRRFQIAQLLHGLAAHDADAVIEVLLDWTDGAADINEQRLQADTDAFVDQYRGVPLKQLSLGAMLQDVTLILRDHNLALPPDLALMIKTFVTLEGLGRQLDPDFDMAAEARPFLETTLLRRHSPGVMIRRGWRALGSATDLLMRLPKDLGQLLRNARRGKLHMEIDVPTLKPFGDQVNHAANRLTLGVVTAALIIGSSIVMHAGSSGGGRGWPTLGVLGFIGAALGGVGILISIWRSGRK